MSTNAKIEATTSVSKYNNKKKELLQKQQKVFFLFSRQSKILGRYFDRCVAETWVCSFLRGKSEGKVSHFSVWIIALYGRKHRRSPFSISERNCLALPCLAFAWGSLNKHPPKTDKPMFERLRINIGLRFQTKPTRYSLEGKPWSWLEMSSWWIFLLLEIWFNEVPSTCRLQHLSPVAFNLKDKLSWLKWLSYHLGKCFHLTQ